MERNTIAAILGSIGIYSFFTSNKVASIIGMICFFTAAFLIETKKQKAKRLLKKKSNISKGSS